MEPSAVCWATLHMRDTAAAALAIGLLGVWPDRFVGPYEAHYSFCMMIALRYVKIAYCKPGMWPHRSGHDFEVMHTALTR